MLLNLCSTLLQTSVLGQCQRTVYEKPSLGDPGAVGGIRATCIRWTAFLFSTFHELRFRLALTHKGETTHSLLSPARASASWEVVVLAVHWTTDALVPSCHPAASSGQMLAWSVSILSL